MNGAERNAPPGDMARAEEVAQIQDALRGLRYGNVNIIVQDGVIVQIDRTEKRRLRKVDPHRTTTRGT